MALGAVSADSVDAAFLGPVPWVETDALPSAEFTPWISIGADDIVTVRVATPEIGNGAMTQTPMLVAEELACDWNKIRAEFAPTSRDIARINEYAVEWILERHEHQNGDCLFIQSSGTSLRSP